jgi:hypothetical protein
MGRYASAVIGGVLAALTVSGAVSAFELTDSAKAPAWYAREVVQTTDGKQVKTVVFGTQPFALSMVDLNQVLSAYGLAVEDWKRAPQGYMREVVTNEGGREVRTIVFSGDAKGMAPPAVDAVLAAYGARVVDAKKLPASYGRAATAKGADGKDVETVVFSPVAYVKSPTEWNAILAAYGK